MKHPFKSRDVLAQRERDMVDALKLAVDLGYNMRVPGESGALVRAEFPELFATVAEQVGVTETDDLAMDDDPMVTRVDGGVWVSCWCFVGGAKE